MQQGDASYLAMMKRCRSLATCSRFVRRSHCRCQPARGQATTSKNSMKNVADDIMATCVKLQVSLKWKLAACPKVHPESFRASKCAENTPGTLRGSRHMTCLNQYQNGCRCCRGCELAGSRPTCFLQKHSRCCRYSLMPAPTAFYKHFRCTI
jgi:hypothetical protein